MLGTQIAHYRILEEIGRGASGSVYLAEDTLLRRRVALKVLTRSDGAMRERLYREARIAARISHPGVVTLYGVHESDGRLFLVYEFVEGKTLRDEIGLDFSLPSFLQTTLDLARALEAAHAMGVVHGDLKPENIIRTGDGSIKVLDFGLAAVLAEAADVPRATDRPAGGTIGYMSPEQIEHLPLDRRSDLFSLGVILYELASGMPPFEGATAASTSVRILTAEPLPLQQRVSAVPGPIADIVWRCLRKAPDDRYQSAAELLRDLGSAGGLTLVAPPAPAAPQKSEGAVRLTAGWWWRFHQLFMAVLYCMPLWPLWRFRAAAAGGAPLFFILLLCAVTAAVVRGHLWFASRFYDALLERQMRRSHLWIRWVDWIFALLVFVGAAVLAEAHAGWAAFLVVIGVVELVAALIIEPATATAAFGGGSEPRA